MDVKYQTMKIKGIIFDYDGLLVDTETPQLRSWQQIYAAHSAQLHLQEWVQCLGTSADAFDPIADLRSKTAKPIDAEDLFMQQRSQVDRALAEEPLRPGISLLLEAARQENLRLAIASSSNRSWVRAGLERNKVLDFFPVICTSENVKQVKPNPELYLLALAQMGLTASDVLAFEDSPNGIRAAKAAGLFCVAYPNAISRQLDLSQADMLLETIDEYTLQDILSNHVTRRSG